MDLILEVRTGRDRVTLACHGKLVGGKEAEAFRRSAMLLLGGFDRVDINLSGVRTLDCGGLGCLAAVLGAAIDKNREVRVTHASRLIREQLKLTGLEQFLADTPKPALRVMEATQTAVA